MNFIFFIQPNMYMRQGRQTKCPQKNDSYNSPKDAFELIFKYLNITNESIWCPFYNDGLLIELLNDYNIIHEKKDFFGYIPDHFDILIDNPPYSIKQKNHGALCRNR